LRIDDTLKTKLRRSQDFRDSIENSNVRDFMNAIKNHFLTGDLPKVQYQQVSGSYERFRQDKDDSIAVYTQKLIDFGTQLELIGEPVSQKAQTLKFLNGLHPKYDKVREKLKSERGIMEKPLIEVSQIAEYVWNSAYKRDSDRSRHLLVQKNRNQDVVAATIKRQVKGSEESEQPNKKSKLVCFNCGEAGHFKKDCTKPINKTSKSSSEATQVSVADMN
jgi:CRISPR/Cas system-associated endoribonuclease Cas2